MTLNLSPGRRRLGRAGLALDRTREVARPALAVAGLVATVACAHSAREVPVDHSQGALAAEHDRQVDEKLAQIEATLEHNRELEDKLTQLLSRLEQLEQRVAADGGRPSRARAPEPDRTRTYAVAVDGNPSVGRADALITIVEGYEYACFYCNKARATLAELAQTYGADLRIVYKPFIVHPSVATASALAACAAHKQGRFQQMDRLLWEKSFAAKTFDVSVARDGQAAQQCWESATGCPVVTGLARELGLSVSRFRADMKGPCMDELAKEQAALRQLGMSATPGFFINGRWLSGAQDASIFRALIDEELAKAKERIANGTPRARYYETWVMQPVAEAPTQVPPPRQEDLARYLQGVPGTGQLLAEIRTSMGSLHCELYPDKAPLTVANFVGLATGQKTWQGNGAVQAGKPFYDGLIFHRVIPGFMIQGGDPAGDGSGGPGYDFVNEISPGLGHVAGALSMANAGPDTNGSQFFITETDRHELDGNYSVFGRCKEVSLVAKITAVARDGADKPLQPVTIDGITFSRGRRI
jgi:cyclophilin family peptidyl-prolyl cis-trans isomerase/protein-disulfide isomerase